MRKLGKAALGLILAAGLGLVQSSAQAVVLSDGGFESASPGLKLAGASLGDGWTSVNNGPSSGVTVNNAAALSHSGNNSVDLAPGNPGGITTTLNTTAGTTYSLTFFADGSFPGNSFGVSVTDASSNSLLVGTPPSTLPYNSSNPFAYVSYGNPSDPGGALTFTAAGPATTLTFLANNAVGDSFLDDVAVTAVPEPTSLALLALPLLALRRRRRVSCAD